jgi:SAM-dependent methyltransferase
MGSGRAREPVSDRRHHLRRWYPEVDVGGFTHVDGTVAFYSRINSVLQPSWVVLDLGCGRGAAQDDPSGWRRELQVLRGKCARVVGADLDPAASTNPYIDDFLLIENGRVALPDGHVDLCVSDAVVEHIDDVPAFFSECARLVKPGGYLCLRTPNVWNYATIATRAIPNRLHTRVLRTVQPGRKEEDVFPTLYRCNTVRRLRATMDRWGFDSVVHTFESEPAYLSFSSVAYFLGVMHQRYAPPAFRRTIMAYGRRRPSTSRSDAL